MIHRNICWSAPLRVAALATAAFAAHAAVAVEPAQKSKIVDRFNTADAAPIEQHAYLDDSAGIAANDGAIEVIRERYANGNVRVERCVILDGEKNYVNHGAWKMFATNGEVLAEGQYDMGKRIGMWTRYVGKNDTSVFNEQPYNKFKAPFISQANFSNGVIDGEWLIEDSDKRKVVQITFKNGERHGPSIAWLPNGKMYRQATYDEGVPVGDVLEVNPKNGEFERTASYVDGRKVINKSTYFQGTRNKKTEATYLAATTVKKSADDFWTVHFATYTSQGKDLRHGAWKEWYANGKPLQEGYYQNDKKAGTFVFWHENGLKSAIGKYQEGTYIGEWRWWNEDGRITKRKTYNGAEGLTEQAKDSQEIFNLGRVPTETADTQVR